MEARDALADHVAAHVRLAPPRAVGVLARALALTPTEVESAQVAGERVEPDVDDLARVVRDRDPPAPRPRRGPRDAHVAQPVAQPGQYLRATRARLDAERPVLDRCAQSLRVTREPEEPVLLDDRLDRRAVLRAAARGELVGREELLAARTEVPRVAAAVEVAGARARAPDPLDRGAMARVRARAHEVVDLELERLGQPPVLVRARRDPGLRRRPVGLRSGHVLQRVLVGAGDQSDRVAPRASMAREGVGEDQLEGESDVWGRVDVGQGGRDVVGLAHGGSPREMTTGSRARSIAALRPDRSGAIRRALDGDSSGARVRASGKRSERARMPCAA